MIDIKIIRDNLELVNKKLEERGMTPLSNHILKLDAELREHKNQTQELQAYRNKLAKEIGYLKTMGADATALLAEVSKTKFSENSLEHQTKSLEEKLKLELCYIPNLQEDDVPVGACEDDNQEIRKWGYLREFSFIPKSHENLGTDLGLMDFETASQLSGSRFVILKGDLAKLERALANFMIDLHTTKHNFVEYSVPALVKENILFGTGQLPKFSEEMFRTIDDRWLISTSEIPLVGMVADKILQEETLPLRLSALTLCFRSEAGATGRDTRGMIRMHQFQKVELVSIANPLHSKEELEYITECAEKVLQLLELPYRTMLLCSKDMGFSSTKTYDIEVWIPSQNKYREISSCSLCTDFQARRMQIRYKSKANAKNTFVHTLNGSGVAVGRCLIAILENYQQFDGSIQIPKVLQSYMNNQEVITKIV